MPFYDCTKFQNFWTAFHKEKVRLWVYIIAISENSPFWKLHSIVSCLDCVRIPYSGRYELALPVTSFFVKIGLVLSDILAIQKCIKWGLLPRTRRKMPRSVHYLVLTFQSLHTLPNSDIDMNRTPRNPSSSNTASTTSSPSSKPRKPCSSSSSLPCAARWAFPTSLWRVTLSSELLYTRIQPPLLLFRKWKVRIRGSLLRLLVPPRITCEAHLTKVLDCLLCFYSGTRKIKYLIIHKFRRLAWLPWLWEYKSKERKIPKKEREKEKRRDFMIY